MKKILVLLFLAMSLILSATTIYEIQYTTDEGADSTYPSPYLGQVVTTTGIVTAVGYNGDKYFISMPEGGEWKGLFIWDWTTVNLGDEIEITGTVFESYGLTEIKDVSNVSVLSSGNTLPAPVQVSTNEIVDGEAYESVLVRVTDVEVTNSVDHGEYYVNDGSGECQVDDEFFKPEPTPVDVSVGSHWAHITGVVDYGFGEYGLNPRTIEDFVAQVSNQVKSWGKVKSLYQ